MRTTVETMVLRQMGIELKIDAFKESINKSIKTDKEIVK